MQQDEGITYKLFSEEEEPVVEPEPSDDEEGKPKPPKEVPPKLPRHILVPEVVREPKMHFYTVPRLGSYLAVRLEYNSCLQEEAFDAAVADFASVAQLQVELDREKHEWEEAQNEIRLEKQDAGEAFVPEEKVWPVYKHAPFKT